MSGNNIKINHKGSTVCEVPIGKSAILKVKGLVVSDDIEVVAPESLVSIIATDAEMEAIINNSIDYPPFSLYKFTGESSVYETDALYMLLVSDSNTRYISKVDMALPTSCTPLNYLEGTGTQYIDTGFIPNYKSRIEFDFQDTTSSSIVALFGARNGSADSAFNMWIAGTEIYTQYGNIAYNTYSPITITKNARYIYSINENVASVGDMSVTIAAATFSGYKTLTLFALNRENGSIDPRISSGKLYSCKIWNNGYLARDLIPVLDTNNVPCLYDKVTKEFFYNKGTGTFLYG